MKITNLEQFIHDNKENIYECGSIFQTKYIQSCGIEPVGEYIHKKNKRKIAVFIHSDRLSLALKRWSENKPKKIGRSEKKDATRNKGNQV